MRIVRYLALGFALSLVAAAPAQAELSDDARRLCDEWAASVNAGNADGAVARFDAESELNVQKEDVRAKGTASARRYFAGLFAKYRVRIRFTHGFVNVLPVLIGQTGTYEEELTPIAGGAPIHRDGHYVFYFLRKNDPRVWIVQKLWL
jgi:ketosteroid isomerase-like protein